MREAGLKAKKSEIEEKERRVRSFLESKGFSAVCLTTSKNFAWFTCGGDNHVEITNRRGNATVVVTRDSKFLVTNNIEAGRVAQEEVEGQGFEVLETPWHDDRRFDIIREVAGPGPIGTDFPFPGAELVDSDLDPLRYSLTPEEIDRYRQVGELTATGLEEACRQVEQGMAEHEIAGIMARNLLSRGVLPAVILVAVDERIRLYRHPIPTDRELERYAMLVTCGRKWGLIASATRLVHFGKPPADLLKRHEACTGVDALFISKTSPGREIASLLSEAIAEYGRRGFGEEWKLHHQGGPTGYQTRDFLATPSCKERVRPNQAFAWNPSITGTKSEDTMIATEKGPIVVTETPSWPKVVLEADGVEVTRPDILVV